MKFCTNCGNPIETEKFCTKCGTKVDEAIPANTYPVSAGVPAVKKSSKIIFLIPVVLIALVAVLIFTFFGGRSYKSVVKSYVEASRKADAKKIISLIPDKMIDYLMDEEGFTSKKEIIGDSPKFIKIIK